MAFLIEKYAGAFPLWMSPVQVKVLPITDRARDYALSVADKLRYEGIRVEVDTRNEKIGYKIREAKMEKTPYILVVGDKECEECTVNVNKRGVEEKQTVLAEEFVKLVVSEDKNKVIF